MPVQCAIKYFIRAFSLHEDHGDQGCWQRKEAGPREDGSCFSHDTDTAMFWKHRCICIQCNDNGNPDKDLPVCSASFTIPEADTESACNQKSQLMMQFQSRISDAAVYGSGLPVNLGVAAPFQ